MDFPKHFNERGYFPLPHADLCDVLAQCLALMGQESLAWYIDKNIEKNGQQPMRVIRSRPGEYTCSSVEELHYWYKMQQDLKETVRFYEAARANKLSPDDTQTMFKGIIENEEYNFISDHTNLEAMSKALDLATENGDSFQDGISDFCKMVEYPRSKDGLHRIFQCISKMLTAGMTPVESMDIILDVYENSFIPGYALMSLYQSMETLGPNSFKAHELHHFVKAFTQSKEGYGTGNLKQIVTLLEPIVTRTPLSLKDVAQVVHARHQGQCVIEKTGVDADTVCKQIEARVNFDQILKKDVETYFPEIRSSRLLVGSMPYRLKKGFYEGIDDLKKLVPHADHEGSFIFSPEKETWYSLGGATRIIPGGLRHEFQAYDAALLSKNPVHVHMHLKDGETFVVPPREILRDPSFQTRLTKFYTAMPSGADYKLYSEMVKEASSDIHLTSCIVTSMGLTEIVMPQDAEKIANVATEFLRMKNDVVQEYDYDACELDAEGTEGAFVQKLVPEINKKLGDGFSVTVHPA